MMFDCTTNLILISVKGRFCRYEDKLFPSGSECKVRNLEKVFFNSK